MAAKRYKPMPPFEVMGARKTDAARGAGSPPAASPAVPDRDGDTVDLSAPTGVGGSYLGWRARTSAPILLRVPRANAVILVFLFAGLIALSYWVGRSLGYRDGAEAGREQAKREQQDQTDWVRRIGNTASTTAAPTLVADANGSKPIEKQTLQPGSNSDPRKIGLNYFVVARFPQEDAVLAADFLMKHGVATLLLPDQNTKFYEVIALRGFESIDATAKAFKADLDRLGRLWKQEEKRPNDFDPYPRKHQASTSRGKGAN